METTAIVGSWEQCAQGWRATVQQLMAIGLDPNTMSDNGMQFCAVVC